MARGDLGGNPKFESVSDFEIRILDFTVYFFASNFFLGTW